MKKIAILIRPSWDISRWHKVVSVNNLYEAEMYWRKHIKGRGVTAWTVYASQEEAKKMLADPDYENQTDMRQLFPELPEGDTISFEELEALYKQGETIEDVTLEESDE
jgi:hypothetical protein